MSPLTSFEAVWQRPPEWRSPHRPLRPGERVDLAIIGAGFLGLSAARQAARAGLGVRVLERGIVGSGASGLNGGQVIPGLKYDPETLLDRFGSDAGDRLIDFAARTADVVFDLIEADGLAVPHRRKGVPDTAALLGELAVVAGGA